MQNAYLVLFTIVYKFFRTLQERALRLWNAKTNNLAEAEKAVVKTGDSFKEEKKQYSIAKLEYRILR